jgi:hypothetical protein
MQLRRITLIAAVLSLPALDRAAAQDFLFSKPIAQLTVRAGPVLHNAQGDIYDFITRELTVDRSDFRAMSIGGELVVMAGERIDIALGVAHAEMRSSSEFRDWVDNNDLPIEQTTVLRTTPFAVSVRFLPLARGESISRLAWVPARFTPYVGGGAGVTFYNLRQHGDFVGSEEEGRPVFPNDYEANGYGATLHALAGADFWVTGKVGINLDARYTFGSAPLGDDFMDYETLDVSGLQAGIGLTLRW